MGTVNLRNTTAPDSTYLNLNRTLTHAELDNNMTLFLRNDVSDTLNGNLTIAGSLQSNSLGVGTPASGTAGEIRATNNVTAYYSDDRLKTRLGKIENAVEKVKSLEGFYYEANEVAQSLGYKKVREIGVSAQQVQAVLPEIVVPAPIDENYLTVRYEKLVALLIEAVKEQQDQIDDLRNQLNSRS